MQPQTSPTDALLREIGALADRVRELRASHRSGRSEQIKALEAESRAQWERLRSLRADPTGAELPSPTLGGLYR
ncbi:MAG TPA: hypothetical protein VFY79_12145 [Dehalococcoidia bacterium]|jgi:hypothetical protein|nr:hypothetical protein [Dehalococcoidia bacterium]